MQNARVTPGVERTFDRAKRLVRDAGQMEIEPRHLVLALLDEDSLGTEILESQGVTAEKLPAERIPPAEASEEAPAAHAEIVLGELAQQVFSKAGLLAARQGRYAELGTEHIVFGLVAVESDIARALHECGLTEESVQKRIDVSDDHPESALPVDFELAEIQKAASDETDLYRILDAAANRVREGVRVLEDYVRFAKDDAWLTAELKSLRHELRSALAPVEERFLISSRDSAGDVGTTFSTPGEQHRQTLGDVLTANCKRVQEGLRTLEEYGKIVSPLVGEAISKLRYRFYSFEKRLVVESHSRERLAGRNIYLLATREQCYLEFEIALRIALNAGADIIQLREKNLSDCEIVELGLKVREWTRETGAFFIMNDRPDLAVLVDADGVHVGQEELSVRQARRIVGPNRLIGVSTHTIEEARKAVEDGADYLGVGPVFPSQTKTFTELAGLEFVRQVADEIQLPWYAIGGIMPENLQQVQSAGATRIAVSSAVFSTDSPGDVVLKLREALALNVSE